jgi:hypothetical protein
MTTEDRYIFNAGYCCLYSSSFLSRPSTTSVESFEDLNGGRLRPLEARIPAHATQNDLRQRYLDAMRPPYKNISDEITATSAAAMLESTHSSSASSGAGTLRWGSRDIGGVRTVNGVTSARFKNANRVVKRSSRGRNRTVKFVAALAMVSKAANCRRMAQCGPMIPYNYREVTAFAVCMCARVTVVVCAERQRDRWN